MVRDPPCVALAWAGGVLGTDARAPPPRFYDANVTSLILIIGATPTPDLFLTISVLSKFSLLPHAYERCP